MIETEPTNGGDFVATPLHNLVAVFHGVDSLNLAIKELKENGFARGDIRSFIGQEGIHELDFDGSAHGSTAEALRYFQSMGPDRTYLERYEKYMRDGDCILMVYAPHEKQKLLGAGILRKHAVHRITYFGTFLIEEV